MILGGFYPGVYFFELGAPVELPGLKMLGMGVGAVSHLVLRDSGRQARVSRTPYIEIREG